MSDNNTKTAKKAPRFEVRVLHKYCKGCGLCVVVCPVQKLSMADKPDHRGYCPALSDEATDCTGCMRCATICPDAAIEISRHKE